MSTDLIMWGLNLGILVIVGFGFLIGLMNGFRKSLVMFILTIIWYTLAIIFIPMISKSLLNVNVSFLSSVLPGDFGEITTIKESLPAIMQEMIPSMAEFFQPGSDTLAIIYGGIVLLLNIALLIVFVVLHATIFKIINSLIWLFFKPKRKDDGEKPKKRRLLGGLVGGVKAFLVVLLLAIPMAGLFSMTNSALTFVNIGEEGQETLADVEDLDFYKAYRNSILGKTFGLFKNDNEDLLDERLFDGFFNIEANFSDQKHKLRIRKDLSNLASIYEKIIDVNGSISDIDESIIYKFQEEDLNYIKNKVVAMDLFKFVQVVGGEYAYNYLVENNLITGYETLLTKENLTNIDLAKDLDRLMTVLIKLSSYDYSNIEQNIFMFSDEEVEEVLDMLVEMELLKYGLPVLVNIGFNSEQMKKVLADNNFDIDEIVKPSADNLLADLSNFKNVYKALKSFGLDNFKDFSNILENPDLDISEDNIELLVDAVFGFEIIDINLEVISYYVFELAFGAEENDLTNLFDKQVFVDNFNSNELKHVILAFVSLQSSGLLKEGFDLNALTDNTIDKLAYHISNSELLSKAFGGLLDMVFEGNSEFEISIPSDFSFKGIEGEKEIKALFKGIKKITSGVDFIGTTEAEFEELAEELTSSKIIAYNLAKIIKKMIENENTFGTVLTMPEIDFYGTPGKVELMALYRVINNVDGDFLGQDFFNMNDAEIDLLVDLLTDSKIIAANLKSIVEGLLNNEIGNLGMGLTIPTDFTFEGAEGKLELSALFKGMKAAKTLTTFDYTTINSGTSDDIKETFKTINESTILRPLLTQILDGSGVSPVANYRYQVGDLNYRDSNTFTKVEWEHEIDVLVDIIVIINSGFDLNDPQVDPIYATNYVKIKALMQSSLLYDETTLPTYP